MDLRSVLTKVGFAVLACNSAFAIRNSWGDAGSVAFVLATDAALVLLFRCLREFERSRAGQGGGGRINMGGQYSALTKVGFAVLTCNAAIDTYNARRDPASAALVLACYVVLVTLTGLFVREFARAHGGEQGHNN
ncbi:hypothetical protein BAE44_0013218 [Dichanthelium oligosanthes]|uniref:Uncharacterized protein n=1 Tax=Dichanthelium oligosanthes TaxID=888268 RepID=A0A1E5VL27_9POAL|nr:hypothetical protein BAE44_0013218 [Dichanthelium oligosanthes]